MGLSFASSYYVITKKLIRVLPDAIRDRWIRKATNQEERCQAFPDFAKYAEFIAYEAGVACNSLRESHQGNHVKQKPSKREIMESSDRKLRDKPRLVTLKTKTQSKSPEHTKCSSLLSIAK